MPFYPYECECGWKDTLLLSIKAKKPKTIKCEKCGKRAEATIGSVIVQFKGPGWSGQNARTANQVKEMQAKAGRRQWREHGDKRSDSRKMADKQKGRPEWATR